MHPKTESLFLKTFLPDMISLVNDKVVNVRMSLSEILGEHYSASA